MNVIYICDRKQCTPCTYPTCKHTQDITHAVNFAKFSECSYYEKEQVHCKDCKHVSIVDCYAKQGKYVTFYTCTRNNVGIDMNADDYCSRAERKEENSCG